MGKQQPRCVFFLKKNIFKKIKRENEQAIKEKEKKKDAKIKYYMLFRSPFSFLMIPLNNKVVETSHLVQMEKELQNPFIYSYK